MIVYPHKRIFGLLGAPRSGKDTVAKYLQESRNFVAFAFADKIKEEYGISKEDFEAAKITGDIERLRQELWDFSAKKKLEDPQYFIRLVMEEATNTKESVVITDIRTEDEFYALFQYSPAGILTRVYNVNYDMEKYKDDYRLTGTKISRNFYCNQKIALGRIRQIDNKEPGLFNFYRKLEEFFFKEDIMDLCGPSDTDVPKQTSDNQTFNIEGWRSTVSAYISQFDIREKMA